MVIDPCWDVIAQRIFALNEARRNMSGIAGILDEERMPVRCDLP
jgi:hypothetical protein